MKSPITTHILDTSRGRPAEGVAIRLEQLQGGAFEEVGSGTTNADGRVTDLMAAGTLVAGTFRIHFEIAPYYAKLGQKSFYPAVSIDFIVDATDEHYHVPLLLNPFGFSTYRGS